MKEWSFLRLTVIRTLLCELRFKVLCQCYCGLIRSSILTWMSIFGFTSRYPNPLRHSLNRYGSVIRSCITQTTGNGSTCGHYPRSVTTVTTIEVTPFLINCNFESFIPVYFCLTLRGVSRFLVSLFYLIIYLILCHWCLKETTCILFCLEDGKYDC